MNKGARYPFPFLKRLLPCEFEECSKGEMRGGGGAGAEKDDLRIFRMGKGIKLHLLRHYEGHGALVAG